MDSALSGEAIELSCQPLHDVNNGGAHPSIMRENDEPEIDSQESTATHCTSNEKHAANKGRNWKRVQRAGKVLAVLIPCMLTIFAIWPNADYQRRLADIEEWSAWDQWKQSTCPAELARNISNTWCQAALRMPTAPPPSSYIASTHQAVSLRTVAVSLSKRLLSSHSHSMGLPSESSSSSAAICSAPFNRALLVMTAVKFCAALFNLAEFRRARLLVILIPTTSAVGYCAVIWTVSHWSGRLTCSTTVFGLLDFSLTEMFVLPYLTMQPILRWDRERRNGSHGASCYLLFVAVVVGFGMFLLAARRGVALFSSPRSQDVGVGNVGHGFDAGTMLVKGAEYAVFYFGISVLSSNYLLRSKDGGGASQEAYYSLYP